MLQKYYWSTIRKTIVAFGNMFNDIHIDRRNDEGEVVQTLRIPLAYAPKQKFISRVQVVEEQDRNIEVILPRMAFEMTGIQYDATRKMNSINQNCALVDSTTALRQYSPVPYNVMISLYVYAKNQDDALQVVEQILPYFNPDFILSFKSMPSLGLIEDLPIRLDGVSYDDTYEGDFSERRAIVWTFDFTLRLNFYGPTRKQGVILRSTANLISSVGEVGNPGPGVSFVAEGNPETGDITLNITEFDI